MFELEKSDDRYVFTFAPKLDTAACNGKEKDMLNVLGDYKGRVDFNLSGVDYVSSYFLRICTTVVQHVDDNNLKIQNASPMVKKVFKIAGFDKMIDIV